LTTSVVKIFGIYTRAQIDKDESFWDSVGYQLSQKGETYRDRCTLAEAPNHEGNNISISPAEFAPQAFEEEASGTSIIPALPKEDLEGVRRPVFHSFPVSCSFLTD
jgi:hypothetical protein